MSYLCEMKKKVTKEATKKGIIKALWIIITAPVLVLVFFLLLTAIGVFGTLPSFEELENPKSNIATEIYSEDGVLIGSYFVQNRSFVSYDELSPNLVDALISTEDSRYYSHSGIDFISLARVGVKTVLFGDRNQGGGSTITQQLAKNLFPRDTTIYRSSSIRKGKIVVAKLKEWITAVKLERNYTKAEIIAMYLNTVEYGSNAYGIKSAAYTFFGKSPADLNVEEAAMLIGVVNAPTKYSPVRNYKNAVKRRNTVLSRMEDMKYISRAQMDSLAELPVKLNYRPISHNQGTGTYFREMIRSVMTMKKPVRSQFANDWDYKHEVQRWEQNPIYGWCHKNTKADGTPYNIYRDGLKVYTTLNASMQRYAEDALVAQLRDNVQPAMESQYKAYKTLFFDTDRQAVNRILANAMRYTDRYRNLKAAGASDAEVDRNFNTPVEMKIFSYNGDIDTVMTPRDSILYHKRVMRASFMAMDPNNGHVKAYVGGQDFRYFKYDMVKQGKRQVGSTIKPFVYTFAIDHLGYNPCTLVHNYQTVIETATGDIWSPTEASSKVEYDGELKPLSWGLANSRNNYSAWIMKQAKQPAAVADFIHNMGITSYIDPVYALCLGTPDVSLFEMVASYSTFVNRGVYNEPIFVTRIEDRHGNLIASFTNTSSDAISEKTAYTMLGMLKNVVAAGTAGRLRWKYGLSGEIGGKTGTSQNNSDAWFIGVTPNLVAGGWVGGEDRSVHLRVGGEGAALALPIYGEFMQKVYADPGLGVKTTDMFFVPPGGAVDCVNNIASGEETPTDEGDDEFFEY